MENNHSGNKTKEVILRKKGNKRKTINKKGRKILLGVFIGLVVLLLATLGGAYAIFKGYFNSTNYVKDDKVTVFDDSDISIELDGEGEQANAEDIAKVEADLQQNLETEIKDSKDVLNILLIGTDRRQENWHGNSDSIILASINRQKKQIILTSIMRDTYAAIPGSGNGKINRAHALGGGPLLVQTVEQNLKVDIDYYASVNFNGFMNVIDVIGGIPMYVSPAEVPVANMYIKEINRLNGLPETSGMLPESGGDFNLTGKQALAYSRIRYVGNADYQRTERQRNVLNQVFSKAKELSVTQLDSVAKSILPTVTHNIPEADVMSLLLELPSFMGYEIVSSRVPYDGLFQSMKIGGQGMLVPDWSATISRLHQEIYGN